MDRKNIDKISPLPEDRLLLAKLYDKINSGITRNVFAHSGFLSPKQQQLAGYLFGNTEGVSFFGGYPDAERKMAVYLPSYMDESDLFDAQGPVRLIRAAYYREETPTHRDFLGAMTGDGVTRESIGDILVCQQSCDILVTAEISNYILQQFHKAGRVHLRLTSLPLDQICIPEQKITEIKDTVPSVRFDCIVSSGFRISRAAAVEYIASGKAYLDGVCCEKADRLIVEGEKLSVRGLGKLQLSQIGHTTKKGRISVIIHRYE